MLSNLLYNCETFDGKLHEIEKLYFHLLLVSVQGVPNDLLLIETSLLPLQPLIYGRQLKFFQNFKRHLKSESSRDSVFTKLLSHSSEYCVDLETKYNTPNDIHFQYLNAAKVTAYKVQIYLEINPTLEPDK